MFFKDTKSPSFSWQRPISDSSAIILAYKKQTQTENIKGVYIPQNFTKQE